MASLFIYEDRNHHIQRKWKIKKKDLNYLCKIIRFRNVVYFCVSGKLFKELIEEVQKWERWYQKTSLPRSQTHAHAQCESHDVDFVVLTQLL